MRNILGIHPQESNRLKRKEKSFSLNKTHNQNISFNNKSAILIEENNKIKRKISPMGSKINFIRKNYGKLQNSKDSIEKGPKLLIKANIQQKFPSISPVYPQQINSIYSKNENHSFILSKISQKKSEILLNENIKRV